MPKTTTTATTKANREEERRQRNLRFMGEIAPSLSPLLKRAFNLDSPMFEPALKPKRGDWLSEHDEPGQSVARWRDIGIRAVGARRQIRIVPVGDMKFPINNNQKHSTAAASNVNDNDSQICDIPQTLQQFCSAYFYPLEVVVEPAKISDKITQRVGIDGQIQLSAPELLEMARAIKKKHLATTLCVLVLTTVDIFPRESWNFVFGLASLADSTGAVSLARFHDNFPGNPVLTSVEDALKMKRRAIKVCVHETMHGFGLKHCISYRCVMNGSNHVDEMDAKVLSLCPICLRKMTESVNWDLVERYQRVERCLTQLGLESDAEWYRHRLAELTA